MANDERNFRSSYYAKVGFKNVEENKSMEMLLKDQKVDVEKLKQYCIRYCVPAVYRSFVWKVLLDIIAANKVTHDFVLKHKGEEHDDLNRCCRALQMIKENTPKAEQFHAMWGVWKGRVRFGRMKVREDAYIAVCNSLIDMQCFPDDKDIFWTANRFYDRTRKYVEEIPKLIDLTHEVLEKEDPELFNHMVEIRVMEDLPLAKWFERCFAGVLNAHAVAKIWDKLIGGASCKLLAFVAVTLLVNLKQRLIRSKTISDVLESIENFPEEKADVIANYSIEMWHAYGVKSKD